MSRYSILIDGKPTEMPSVTEILNFMEKPALKQWAANCAVDFIRAGGSLDEAATAWKLKSEDALDVGSIVHHAIEAYVDGRKADFSGLDGELLEQARKSFQSFLDWERENNVQWLASELTVARPPFFAGTLDALAIVNGEHFIMDFKTSAAVYNEYYYQLALYQTALEWTRRNPFDYLDSVRIQHASAYRGDFSHTPKIGVLRIPKDGSPAEWKTKSWKDVLEYRDGAILLMGAYYGIAKRRLKNNVVRAMDVLALFDEDI